MLAPGSNSDGKANTRSVRLADLLSHLPRGVCAFYMISQSHVLGAFGREHSRDGEWPLGTLKRVERPEPVPQRVWRRLGQDARRQALERASA